MHPSGIKVNLIYLLDYTKFPYLNQFYVTSALSR